jgi:hypothetical protein
LTRVYDVKQVIDAKKPETRAWRIFAVIAALRQAGE